MERLMKRIDINNKEDLRNIRKILYLIEIDCPSNLFNFENVYDTENCNDDSDISKCLECWKKAINKRINNL